MTKQLLVTGWGVGCVFAACLAMSGCSSTGRAEPERFPVTGTVMVNGQPLAEGKINFVSPDQGALDTLEIRDGKFEGRAQAGDRRVEINSYRVEIADKDGMQSEAQINLIPPTYNADSQLTAQVTPDGPNSYTFDLKTL